MDEPLSTLDVVMTVLGETSIPWGGLVDAHNHVWISPVFGAMPGSPILNHYQPILKELQDFYATGGRGIIDCQPGGCGRDVRQLAALSKQSGVHIVCCTGFHRKRYYPPTSPIWAQGATTLAEIFIDEIQLGTIESVPDVSPIRAGVIKVAVEASLQETPQNPLEAAAIAAIQTQTAIEIHTEKGAEAETILEYFFKQGVNPNKLILCHMDKRPDFKLHQELAMAGVLLEYDTFYRPQYNPEGNLWPLLEKMITSDMFSSVALATDMADVTLWNSMGKGPGLPGFSSCILAPLEKKGVSQSVIQQLLGNNILNRLAKPSIRQ